jgi:hypothetical protein
VQPNVHGRGVVLITRVAKFGRKFFAGSQAAIHADQLHEIDDRFPPVQFLGVLEAISLSTALTSTLAGAGAPAEDAVDAEPAGGTEEEAGAPAPGVEGPEDEAEVGAFPKIFDIKVLNMFMSRSYADSTKTKGYSGTRPEAVAKDSIVLTGQQALADELLERNAGSIGRIIDNCNYS